MESILNSVKKFIGIDAAYEHFDPEIIMLINSTFATLDQIGLDSEFKIDSKDTVWSDYVEDSNLQSLIREYMCIKVKMTFDPNASGSISQAYKDRISELEWRINAYADKCFKKDSD